MTRLSLLACAHGDAAGLTGCTRGTHAGTLQGLRTRRLGSADGACTQTPTGNRRAHAAAHRELCRGRHAGVRRSSVSSLGHPAPTFQRPIPHVTLGLCGLTVLDAGTEYTDEYAELEELFLSVVVHCGAIADGVVAGSGFAEQFGAFEVAESVYFGVAGLEVNE